MSTNPEFEYLNLKSMYELTSQVLAESDTDDREKAQNMTIMETDLFHAALEAGEKKEAEQWLRSILSRGEQIQAWEKEDPDADLDWWHIIAASLAEEFSRLEAE